MNEALVKIKDDKSFNKCIPVFCANVVIRDGGGERDQWGPDYAYWIKPIL